MHPLKRVGPKGSGQFERVSWDEALQDMASRLKTIASRAPPAAIRMNYGLQRVHGGCNAVHLIASLPALIGTWRKTFSQGVVAEFENGFGLRAFANFDVAGFASQATACTALGSDSNGCSMSNL